MSSTQFPPGLLFSVFYKNFKKECTSRKNLYQAIDACLFQLREKVKPLRQTAVPGSLRFTHSSSSQLPARTKRNETAANDDPAYRVKLTTAPHRLGSRNVPLLTRRRAMPVIQPTENLFHPFNAMSRDAFRSGLRDKSGQRIRQTFEL